jgi:hypothetical protein
MFEDFLLPRQDSQSFSNKISAHVAVWVAENEVKLWFHLPSPSLLASPSSEVKFNMNIRIKLKNINFTVEAGVGGSRKVFNTFSSFLIYQKSFLISPSHSQKEHQQ